MPLSRKCMAQMYLKQENKCRYTKTKIDMKEPKDLIARDAFVRELY